ncbi:heavy metal translocating P-type ATPase metal-binding domain-containing protein [Cerasicoccus fimbriatus]|uniref:heavy metal translocating P-type ATPase metal-binding domain-containing protein n=1 Tax=Cerasicoccus fimbriatus TaxID=3014554 RepID=UPI0022B3AC6D|nr:heavy metal translocating P-type ATPase metal-binding domain-containing protein [Cerasicoccus sp. TK19100]
MTATSPDQGTNQRRTCTHCGAPFLPRSGEAFCCHGCEAVYHHIHEAGLVEYYQRKSGLTEPLLETPFEPHSWTSVFERARNAEKNARGEVSATFPIQGISCPACAWLLNKIAMKQPGLVSAETAPPYHTVELRWESATVDFRQLANELQSFGLILDEAPQSPTKPALLPVILGGAFAVNAVILKIASRYLASESVAYTGLMNWMSILLALLAVYCLGHSASRWQRYRKRAKS